MKSIHHLRLYPDPILRQRAMPVREVDRKLVRLLRQMEDTIRANNGVGLAATQVGVRLRVIVAEAGGEMVPLINPEIVGRRGESVLTEGCLSMPNLRVNAARNESVTVSGIDIQGEEFERDFEGLESRIVQHLCDHLNGVLIIDHTRHELMHAKDDIP